MGVNNNSNDDRWGQLAKLNNRIIMIKVGVYVYIIYEISYTNLNFVACAY